jgi:hypothetical protein
MSSDLKDLVEFDRSLNDLFTLMKEILKTHEKQRLNLSSKKNPFSHRLNKYIKIYEITEPEEHIWYFSKLYSSNRTGILRGPDRDGWLKNGKIVIHYGEEVGRCIKDAQIHLSVIYNTSCTIRDDTTEMLKGLPNTSQSEELTYPKKFLLYLYRIFNEVCDSEEDQSKIADYIYDLEEDTGIKKSKKRRSNDSLLDTATELMEQFGFKIPKDQLPSSEELSGKLKGAMNNPEISSVFGNIMKEVQGCDNVGDMIAKVVGSLGSSGTIDETTANNLKGSVPASVSGISNPLKQTSDESSPLLLNTNNNGDDFGDFLD